MYFLLILIIIGTGGVNYKVMRTNQLKIYKNVGLILTNCFHKCMKIVANYFAQYCCFLSLHSKVENLATNNKMKISYGVQYVVK